MVFKKDDKYGRLNPINNRPMIIFSGMATKNTFICGIVRAISPKATLVINKAAMTGAPTLRPSSFSRCATDGTLGFLSGYLSGPQPRQSYGSGGAETFSYNPLALILRMSRLVLIRTHQPENKMNALEALQMLHAVAMCGILHLLANLFVECEAADNKGDVIGAVGVTGDTSENDAAAATVGIEAAGLVAEI